MTLLNHDARMCHHQTIHDSANCSQPQSPRFRLVFAVESYEIHVSVPYCVLRPLTRYFKYWWALALLHRLDGSRTPTDPTYNPRSRTPRRRSGSRPFQSETLSSLPSFRPVCGSQLRVEDSLSSVKPFGQTLFFGSPWAKDMNTSFGVNLLEIAEESRTPSVGSVGVDRRVQTPGSSPGSDGSALPGCLGNAAGVDVS